MKTLLKRLKTRLLAILPWRRDRGASETTKNDNMISIRQHRVKAADLKAKDLLPERKPLFASLRPGLQHCQIHDPKYLSQILEAELESDPSSSSSNGAKNP